MKEYKDDKLERFYHSEEPPTVNNGPVKVVVGKTHKEIVMENDKDVFVEYYHPNHADCKNVEPIWE